MEVHVWQVEYLRSDGVATSPIVCLSLDYALAVVRALAAEGVRGVDRVCVTRRPAMPGEAEYGR